jgi:GNAT superfamily N-acetyltransferase
MSKFKIQISTNKTDHDAVLAALIAYNVQHVGASGKTELTFQIKDDSGLLLAGANGYNHWNYFFLAHLWVHESQRGKRVGSQLLAAVEAEAIARGCTDLWLDTFSFQAAGFYEKCGYKRFGQLDDYPMGHHRYFYVKKL